MLKSFSSILKLVIKYHIKENKNFDNSYKSCHCKDVTLVVRRNEPSFTD